MAPRGVRASRSLVLRVAPVGTAGTFEGYFPLFPSQGAYRLLRGEGLSSWRGKQADGGRHLHFRILGGSCPKLYSSHCLWVFRRICRLNRLAFQREADFAA